MGGKWDPRPGKLVDHFPERQVPDPTHFPFSPFPGRKTDYQSVEILNRLAVRTSQTTATTAASTA